MHKKKSMSGWGKNSNIEKAMLLYFTEQTFKARDIREFFMKCLCMWFAGLLASFNNSPSKMKKISFPLDYIAP